VEPVEVNEWDGRESGPPAPTRVRTRRRKQRSGWRRWVVLAAGVLFIVLAAGAWLGYDGLRARSELTAVKSEVHTLRAQIAAGDLGAARSTAQALRRHADSAHGRTSDPIWSLGEHLPVMGGPLRDVRTLTDNVTSIADHALPSLIDATTVLAPRELRRSDGSIALARIQRLAVSLDAAGRTLEAARTGIARMPTSDWSSINSARADLLAQLPPLIKTVSSATLAARLIPPLLGVESPKNYMITFENDAEMRATGGLPGAFAILHVDDGAFAFTQFEPDGYLVGTTASDVRFGGDYDALYGTGHYGASSEYRNSNLSPHYPYAAQLWLSMWRHKTGQQLDGAFVIDPTALSYLLRATGPTTLPDGTSVRADNVVALTESTVYTKFAADNAARKDYLLAIAKAVSQKMLARGIDTAGLLRAAARAAGESRLLFWTRDEPIEAQLADLPLSGVEPETAAPYFRLTLWNSTGSKLDYYLHAAVDWTRTGCGPTRQVTVTVRLSNAAPVGLSSYVLGETADKQFRIAPGDEYLSVLAYGTTGADLQSYTVDGKTVDLAQFGERGHPVWSDGEFVPLGKTLTLVYRMVEPAGVGAPIIPAQPMVNPMAVSVHDAACR
jgi:hypothetical protein